MNKFQRIALAEKDLTVKQLGTILDKHPNYISGVLSGHYKTPRIRRALASVLDKPEDYLWPDQQKNQS